MKRRRMLALWLAALLLLPGCMWKKLGGEAEQETELEQAQNVTEDTAGETELTEPSGQDPGSAETPDPEPSAPVVIDPINPPDNPPEPAPADPAEQFPAPAPDDGHVYSISLDKYKVVVQVGQSDMPWVTMYPESAENKGEVWTSNDTAVATVNSWGNITGVNEGSCQVTVRSADNPDVKAVVDLPSTRMR